MCGVVMSARSPFVAADQLQVPSGALLEILEDVVGLAEEEQRRFRARVLTLSNPLEVRNGSLRQAHVVVTLAELELAFDVGLSGCGRSVGQERRHDDEGQRGGPKGRPSEWERAP